MFTRGHRQRGTFPRQRPFILCHWPGHRRQRRTVLLEGDDQPEAQDVDVRARRVGRFEHVIDVEGGGRADLDIGAGDESALKFFRTGEPDGGVL